MRKRRRKASLIPGRKRCDGDEAESLIFTFDHNDVRGARTRVRSSDGLTLRQAMLFYDERQLAERFLELEAEFEGPPPLLFGVDGCPTPPDVLNRFYVGERKLWETRFGLEYCLVSKLIEGRLTATGYGSNDPIDEPARSITADRWRILEPSFQRSEANGPGVVISGLLVFRKAVPDRGLEQQRRFARAEVRAWYRDWVKENEAKGIRPSRDADLSEARRRYDGITREFVRELRRELAPRAWQERGRRKSGSAP